MSFFESPIDLRIKVERDVKRLLLSRNLRDETRPKALVEKGITIVAPGNQSYFIGEKVQINRALI